MKIKVIAIGAHPDDIEIGCAGTIRKFIARGADVYFIIATLGEQCHVEDSIYQNLRVKRQEESNSSAKILGVKEVFFLGLPDTNIEHNGETVSLIERYIYKIDPQFLFVHTKEDNHQDHKSIAFSTISAARRRRINILHYESPSTAQSFMPVVHCDISDTLDYKLNAISQFVSQNEKIYVDKEAIKGLAKYRGYISGTDYAEGFELSKYFI